MKLARRIFLHLAASAAALPALPWIARAQTYPTRPVDLIVGTVPAATPDIDARLIGQWLSERLGQAFIVQNRPGAGTNIATEMVVRAAPDGYTLFLITTANAVNATLYDHLNFNFIRDIAPVAALVRTPLVMEVNPSVPVKTVPEFIAYAKANPGKINMASSGNGTPQQIAAELFTMMAGVNVLHVPYRSTGPAIVDLLSGQMQVMFDTIPASLEFIRAGKLRPLGVSTATRLEVLPDVPPVGDSVPGYEASAWQGVGAPKSTPAEIVDKLNKEINAGLADAKIKARFAELGAVPIPMTPAEFAKFIADETEKFAKVIKFAGIKPE
ncbi:MAG: tripartite tricarboxylate transporter substrate binding protein [Xanthobacteraceae bacterium]